MVDRACPIMMSESLLGSPIGPGWAIMLGAAADAYGSFDLLGARSAP
jgi:hypothetical protein